MNGTEEKEEIKDPTRQEKILSGKLDDIELERFSISSLNLFRTNRISWYLRYILDFKSVYPMEGAWRGQAIESAINKMLKERGKNAPENIEPSGEQDLIDFAMRHYQSKILTSLFKIYEETLPGFDKEKIPVMLREKEITEFPGILKLIVDGHFKINEKQKLPGFLVPDSEDYLKFLRKVERQYPIINEAVKYLHEYFLELPEDCQMQGKIKSDHYGIAIPTIGYFDYEFPEFGLDLKTSDAGKIPKKWEDVPIGYKCQSAFYSVVKGKPWGIVYGSRLSKDDLKKNVIISLAKQGLDPAGIVTAYKEQSPDGKGTTKGTVEKYLDGINLQEWKPAKACKVFMMPAEEVEYYDRINQFTAKSVLKAIESSKKGQLEEDMKYFCLSDTEHMFLSPDESEKIMDSFGFKIPTTEEMESENSYS